MATPEQNPRHARDLDALHGDITELYKVGLQTGKPHIPYDRHHALTLSLPIGEDTIDIDDAKTAYSSGYYTMGPENTGSYTIQGRSWRAIKAGAGIFALTLSGVSDGTSKTSSSYDTVYLLRPNNCSSVLPLHNRWGYHGRGSSEWDFGRDALITMRRNQIDLGSSNVVALAYSQPLELDYALLRQGCLPAMELELLLSPQDEPIVDMAARAVRQELTRVSN
ncbi:MAG: hypothetical protein WBP26_03830 [Candidatus Saccharimonadales bacterium]